MPETPSDLHYFQESWLPTRRQTLSADVAIYGGTPAGVFAAVAARRLGRKVVLLHPGNILGGMTTGGLGFTDFGNKNAVGGMARQFYRDLGRAYGRDENWAFEPHIAQKIIDAMIAQAGVSVHFGAFLETVALDGRRIAEISLLGGSRIRAAMFIDATYEGDLMARSGVSFTVGREANSVYRETFNGVQVGALHQFSHAVDPYVVAGDPASGLLPQILPEDMSARQGQGDARVQAYCFRVCMTDDPALRILWERPADYDQRQYVLARRWFQGPKDNHNEHLRDAADGPDAIPAKFDRLAMRTPGGFHKTDTNNHGPVSSDFIGMSWAWPEADYRTRERIFQAHVTYQKGFYWHMANCPDIPERYRRAYQRWGLARDEFMATGHWPHQLYVREARRLVSDYVLTEHDCRCDRRCADPVAMGSYGMDSHNCSRFVTVAQGRPRVLNEGDVQVPCVGPYGVSYRSIIPRRGECENLLAPVCLSASHIAYGSVRMEPVFMALGQAAALAAQAALHSGTSLQDIDVPALQQELRRQGAVLEL